MLRTRDVLITIGLSVLVSSVVAAEAARSWQADVAAADLDRDGALSPPEVLRAPRSAGEGLKPLMARHYKTMDRNGDGQLEVAEIQSWQRQHGVSDETLTRTIEDRPMTGTLE